MALASPRPSIAPPGEREHARDSLVVLPSGRSLDLCRTRWDGVLDTEELAYCRAAGIPLGYDTAQIGWVLLDSEPSKPDAQTDVRVATGVTFRRWRDHDGAAHRALLDDRAVWEHLPEQYPEPFTEATSRDLIALANADIGHEVVAVEVDGELVGQCLIRLDHFETPPLTAEVAYWLGREHWGRSVMTRVLPEFVDRCFERHPVEEIYAWIRPDNVASARVAARAGLRRTPVPNEAELAAAHGRPGFLRWSVSRTV